MAYESHKMQFDIDSANCDLKNRLKLSNYLKFAQIVSNYHCLSIGVDDKVYKQTHSAFLLAKLTLIIDEDVHNCEKVDVQTTTFMLDRAIFHRYNTFTDSKSGKVKAKMVADWMTVDTQTRKILRKLPDGMPYPFELMYDKKTYEVGIDKYKKIKATNKVGDYTVKFSNIDNNGHFNNALYANLICDYMPTKVMIENSIRQFTINYRREILLGETMEIYCDVVDNVYIVQGIKDNNVIFDCNLIF